LHAEDLKVAKVLELVDKLDPEAFELPEDVVVLPSPPQPEVALLKLPGWEMIHTALSDFGSVYGILCTVHCILSNVYCILYTLHIFTVYFKYIG
jgi:hypothetical protein